MTGFIYFLQARADGPIKIGHTNNVARRFTNIQIGCPDKLTLLGTIAGDLDLECRIHQAFRRCLVRGEWFAPHRWLLAFIKKNVRRLPEPDPEIESGRRLHPLARYRAENQLTQAELARLVGTTDVSISRWENGNRVPHRKLFPKIKAATGIGAGALIEYALESVQ